MVQSVDVFLASAKVKLICMLVIERQPALTGRLSYALVKVLDYLGLVRLRLNTEVKHCDRSWEVTKVLLCILEDLQIRCCLLLETRFNYLSTKLC
jgi:hypothetical protein